MANRLILETAERQRLKDGWQLECIYGSTLAIRFMDEEIEHGDAFRVIYFAHTRT